MISTLFVLESLQKGFIGILLTLDTLIYSLISSSFKVFMAIAGARLLSSDAYFDIANKIYVVVGVLMLFVLSYAILKAIVDPEQTTKGEFGPKMIKNVVIAVVGLAIAPVLFNLMYQAQGLILEQDVLGKLFFRIENTETVSTGGSVTTENGTVTFDDNINPDKFVKSIGGAVTATSLWQAFFYPAEDSGLGADEIIADPSSYYLDAAGSILLCAGSIALAFIPGIRWLAIGAAVATCGSAMMTVPSTVKAGQTLDGKISLQQAYSLASGGEGFGIFTVFLSNYIDDGEITYLFGISTIAGAFALFAFVSFSIDMGVRAAKLAYLQIIAPVPLVMQVLPKFKENFNSYIKSVTSTFIEVFVRISVVYVVVYIICHLTDLFSSVSTWTDTNGLNAAEQLFALAFLILGLIAFCRKAPEIITETLHLPKGNMHLGIGKKLSDGGFHVARSIATGGLKSGVRNWTETRDNRKNAGFTQRALSFLGGMGSGAARAAMMNFGPGHKPAETWRQASDIAENASQAANDAHEKRWDRIEQHDADVAARNKAQEAVDLAAEAYENAKGTPLEQEKKDAYLAAVAELNRAAAAAEASSLLNSITDDLQKRAKAWTTGTVSTAKEDANIKFGTALDKVKGDARNEAYKKDAAAQQFKRQLETLEATKISEYKDGWDDQSYSEEIRNRVAGELTDLRNKQVATSMARQNLEAARTALTQAQANGASAAQIAQLQTDITNKENALAAAESLEGASQATLDAARQRAAESVDAIAKRTSDEMAQARAEMQVKIKASRDAMEAAADAYVARQLADATSNVYDIYQQFINENATYISENASTMFTVDDKGHKKSVQEILSAFGGEASKGGKIDVKVASSQNSFDLVEGGQTITYKFDDREKVNGQDNPNYLKYVSSDGSKAYKQEDFFSHVFDILEKESGSTVKAKTASAKTSDEGKFGSKHIRNSEEYISKVQRKRQAQENKGGKK